MTEEELKDRISMALKDPILQQGFECICKENSELKNKNKVLELYADLADGKVDEVKLELFRARRVIMKFVKIYANPHSEEEIKLRDEVKKLLEEIKL